MDIHNKLACIPFIIFDVNIFEVDTNPLKKVVVEEKKFIMTRCLRKFEVYKPDCNNFEAENSTVLILEDIKKPNDPERFYLISYKMKDQYIGLNDILKFDSAELYGYNYNMSLLTITKNIGGVIISNTVLDKSKYTTDKRIYKCFNYSEGIVDLPYTIWKF